MKKTITIALLSFLAAWPLAGTADGGISIGIGGWTDGNKYAQTEGDFMAENMHFKCSTNDENGISILGGSFHMNGGSVEKSGNTELTLRYAAHQGGNSACYCGGGNSTMVINGGSITTSGQAAGGVTAYKNAKVSISNAEIKAEGNYACALTVSYGASMTVEQTTLKVTDSSMPAILAGMGMNIIRLTDCHVEAASGILLRAERNTTSSGKTAAAQLHLGTTSTCIYTGIVEADSYGKVSVYLEKGVTWRLTGNCTIDTLVMEGGTVDTNGYKLTARVTTTTGIESPIKTDYSATNQTKDAYYSLQGIRMNGNVHEKRNRIVIHNGRKYLQK